jgi:hypothetical protein
MCPPVIALATIAISAASAYAGYQAQQQQFQAQKEQKAANDTNALAAARDDQNRLTLRSIQEQQAYTQKAHNQNIELAENTANVEVSAAGSNVAGISVGNLVSDARRRAGNNLTTLETNYQNTAAQLQAEAQGTVTKANTRIAAVAQPTEPSPTGAILGFAGDVMKNNSSGLSTLGDTAKTMFRL